MKIKEKGEGNFIKKTILSLQGEAEGGKRDER
jgi:hypothetical protein